MKITQEQLDSFKSHNDPQEFIHLKGNTYVKCGTYGMSFLKRRKFDFEDIININDFRNKTLSEINSQL